jgi:LysM repeat protein
MNTRIRVLAVILTTSILLAGMSTVVGAAPPPTPAAPEVTAPPAPTWPAYPVYHVVQWGENLYRIALRYGTSIWAIAQANGLWNINYIRAGQVLLIPVSAPAPAPSPQYYVVRFGDTLSAIAWRFGTSVWSLAQANGIWNPNLIYVGQRLYIP